MIAVSTAVKRYSEELSLLRANSNQQQSLPRSLDYYDRMLAFNQVKRQSFDALLVIADIIEELLSKLNEHNNPFEVAAILLSKAFVCFRIGKCTKVILV